MNLRQLALLTVVVAFVSSCISHAADWPEFRGPGRDAVSTETGLLKKWPESGPELIWSQKGIGAGFATVVIAGDRIYTSGDEGDSNYLHALKRDGGDKIWSHKIGKSGGPGWGDFMGPRSTPAVDGDRVYALGQYGELVCCASETGDELWRKHFVEDFGGKLPDWGFSEGLLVDDKRLVCTPGGDKGTVIALDKMTGETIWRCAGITDTAAYSSLIRAKIGGVPQYIVLTQENLAGIVVTDGKLLWKAARKGRTAVCTTPVYKDGHIYVTSGYDIGCHLFEITKKGDGFIAQEKYDTKANRGMLNHHGGVVLVGDHVYGHSDTKGWVCQHMASGELKWGQKKKLAKGSVAYADGKLFVREEGGKGKKPRSVAVIKATTEGFEELGRFDPPHRSEAHTWAVPVILDGRLYVRDDTWLFCYDVREKK